MYRYENDIYLRTTDDAQLGGEVYTLLSYLSPKYFNHGVNNVYSNYFGDVELRAVQAFQRDSGIAVTDHIDFATRAKLKQLTCGESVSGAKPHIKGLNPSQGVVGSEVFMLGTNLSTDTLYFNGSRTARLTPIERDGENTMRFIVPQLPPGKYAVVVENSAGKSNTLFFTINDTKSAESGLSGYCAEYYNGVTRPVPIDPAFKAHGFQKVEVAFKDIWSTEPGYSSGTTKGVPGDYLNPSNGRYLSIPITIGYRRQLNLNWVELQGQAPGVFTGPVVATISPCPGDFRKLLQTNLGNGSTNDGYVNFGCRIGPGISGSISAAGTPSLSGCFAPPGKQMYLNIATHDMFDSMNRNNGGPGETLCGTDVTTCGVALRN